MELRAFVSETINQIIAGVADAQESAQNHNAVVNPQVWRTTQNANAIDQDNGTLQQVISFDVAVTTVEGAGREGAAGIFVGPLALGGRDRSSAENTAISQIRFSVPITLPYRVPEELRPPGPRVERRELM